MVNEYPHDEPLLPFFLPSLFAGLIVGVLASGATKRPERADAAGQPAADPRTTSPARLSALASPTSASPEEVARLAAILESPAGEASSRWNNLSRKERDTLAPYIADVLEAGEILAFAEKISESDPATVLMMRALIPKGIKGEVVIQKALKQAWKQDAEGTLRWLVRLDPETVTRMVNGNGKPYRALLDFSPEQARRLAEAMPAGHFRDSMLGHVLPRLALNEALPLMEQMQSPQLRDKLLSDLAEAHMEDEPNAARELVGRMTDPGRREEAMRSLADKAKTFDLSYAFEVTFEIDDKDERRRSISNLMSYWVRSDPVMVSEWLAKAEPGLDRDVALSSFTYQLRQIEEFDVASAWVREFNDSEWGDLSAMMLGTDWLKRDRTAAERWLRDESGLPPEKIEMLLNR